MKERMFGFEKGILFTRQSTNKLQEERLLGKEQPHQPVLQEAVLGHSSTLAGFCTGDKCAGIFRRASKGQPAVCRCVSGPVLCRRQCVPSSALLVFQVDSLPLSAPHEPLTGWAMTELAFCLSFLLNGIKRQLLSFCTAGRARYRVRVCSFPASCGWD